MKKIIILICIFSLTLSGCKENYSNGERIGFITKLTKRELSGTHGKLK